MIDAYAEHVRHVILGVLLPHTSHGDESIMSITILLITACLELSLLSVAMAAGPKEYA